MTHTHLFSGTTMTGEELEACFFMYGYGSLHNDVSDDDLDDDENQLQY